MKFPETRTLIVDRRDEDDEFGIIMFKDIAQRVLAPDLSPERISCYEIMSKPAVGVHPKMNVRYCVQLLDRFGLSRAPVIKGRKVVGLVSYTDIVLKSVMMQD
jgi:predicted transcriptional regulator